MKAQELNGTHIGELLTLTVGEASVTDRLIGVRTSADVIDVGLPMFQASGRREVAIGRKHLTLQFQVAGDVGADPESEVTLHV